MIWWQGLKVAFVSADLAATYNSKAEVERRWGSFGVATIGRRLLELAAAEDIDEVATLPGASVQPREDGALVIVFRPEEITVSCQLDAEHPDCLRVSDVCWVQELAR